MQRPVMVVAGTRPEAIKLAPLLWELDRKGIEYIFVWSGQHYDYKMSRIFFDQLNLPIPDIDLDVKSGTHGEQTSRIIVKLEKAILQTKPSIVIAQGDTNTTLAAAISSVKSGVPFGHVEAGLRSWDHNMPEEINRIVADVVADLLFVPTRLSAINLLHEGISLHKIHITGNTIVDVVIKYRNYINERSEELLKKFDLEPRNYILVTVHRQENTDNKARFHNIVNAFIRLSKEYRIVFPVHPRALNKLVDYKLLETIKKENILLIEPLGYFEFMGLLMNSLIVLTDSGGVQEEASIVGVPTLTLRDNTERPETVLAGINRVVGTCTERIVNEALKIINHRDKIINKILKYTYEKSLYGDGQAAIKIVNFIIKYLNDTLKENEDRVTKDRFWKPITYKLINKYICKKFNINKYEIISMYDNKGDPTINLKDAMNIVIRLPMGFNEELCND